MSAIARAVVSAGSQALFLPIEAAKGASKVVKGATKGTLIGLGAVAQVASGSLTTATALYLQYLVLSSAFDAVSGYAGQYRELKGGFQDVGFTSKEIGSLFQGTHGSGNSWNILELSFDPRSLKDVQDVLNSVYEHSTDLNIMQVRTAQILSKVLIGKNAHFLQAGHKITVPSVVNGNKELVEYTFDKKFDLWQGVPAFGFIDEKGISAPLLIFRSTNTDLEESDTLPTMTANLHPQGPAWKLFSESQEEISKWLENANNKSAQKARTIGFSQGGVLASYFLTYNPEQFNKSDDHPSLILDAPGVSSKIEKEWLGIEKKPSALTYVNRGDLIPKIGDAFVGRAFEVRIAQNLRGFESHRALSLFAPQWKIVEISTRCEKNSRSRGILSGVQKVLGAVIYTPVKKILLPCMQGIFNS